jgi:hypothetical protein
MLGSGFRVVPLQRTSQFRNNDKHQDGPIKPLNLRTVRGFPFTNVISQEAKRHRVDSAVSVLDPTRYQNKRRWRKKTRKQEDGWSPRK